MLSLTDYNIAKNVHIYRHRDLNIAYDINSGSFHLLDEKTYNLIEEMIAYQEKTGLIPDWQSDELGAGLPIKEKEEILRELGSLQQENVLFSKEIEVKEPFYSPYPLIKALCLHVAHDCDLRCRYCFAGTGPFGGRRELMSRETGIKALDLLLKHNGDRPHCEVDFFGGEPLLNFSVVQDLIAYGKKAAAQRGKRMKFTLTTNAVLLDEKKIDFFEQEEISLVLSLDGRKEVNDKMRPFSDGKGSYDLILPKILNLAEKRSGTSRYATGCYYYVRGTYTHYNTDFYRDVLHMADLGIDRISIEPVVASDSDHYAIRKEDIEQIKESYYILGDKILEYEQAGKGFAFFHFNAGLDEGPCLAKRLSGCGAGHEYIAVSPEGGIYPCHQFVGQEQYKLGSVNNPDQGLRQNIIEEFRRANIYSKEKCRSCWARFFCSGGCHAANAVYGGGLTEVYSLGCEIQKKRLEVACYLQIKQVLNRGNK